jgi:hypothetical protein
MKKFLLFLLVLSQQVLSASPFSIVFVHIGNELPTYIGDALDQARLFNKDASILLIANRTALEKIEGRGLEEKLILVEIEKLSPTKDHLVFKQTSTLSDKPQDGYLRYATERFFYIHELMLQYELTNVFQLETDNMLYADLEELLPIFVENYKGMGAVFDCPSRCIPSFVYFADASAAQSLTHFLTVLAKTGKNDMQLLASYKNRYGAETVDALPIISQEYLTDHPHSDHSLSYSRHLELFQSVFDGAALGQYLGGTNAKNNTSGPGFINETCIFNPSLLAHKWELDDRGRKVPFIVYRDKQYRVNNLHIHSKNLKTFSSK